MTEGVFVSYRREDAPGHAGRLYDRLITRFGEDRVFMDVDSIDPGDDFVDAIESTLTSASVVVVVIGPAWVTARDEQGVVRLTKPDDFVHLEISRARQLQKRVIPVLVDGASVPEATELPEDLKWLARRNAFEVSDARFHSDADRLADAIAEDLSAAAAAAGTAAAGASRNEPVVPQSQRVVPPPILQDGRARESLPPAPQPDDTGLGARLRRLGLPVLIALIVALVMVVGAIAWALSSRDDTTSPDTTSAATSAATTGGSVVESPSADSTTGEPTATTQPPPTGATDAPTAVAPTVITDLSTSGQPADVLVAGGTLWASVDGGIERFAPPGPDAEGAGTVDLGGPGFGNDLIEWDGVLYVTRYDGRSLVAVDLATGTVLGTPIELPGKALTGVVSEGTLWLTVHGSSSGAPGSVVAVEDGAVVGEIALPQLPYQIEAVGDQLWVTLLHAGTLGMIDKASGEVAEFPVGTEPVDVRLIGEQLWVTLSGDDQIALVDPATGGVTQTIQVGDRPWKVVEGFGSVWVSNRGEGSVMGIDPSTLEVGEPIPVGAKPDEIAVGTDDLFVGNFEGRSISVIDPG